MDKFRLFYIFITLQILQIIHKNICKLYIYSLTCTFVTSMVLQMYISEDSILLGYSIVYV